MREIEVKLKARDLEALQKKLEARGCALSAPIRQHDVIYSRAGSTVEWEESKQGHIVMRVRRMDNKAEFNLKEQRSSEMDNIEYETEVKNPEAMEKILSVLGYAPQVEVEKIRRKGKLGEYEICLDQVKELGNFVEIEKLTDDEANPDNVREELFGVLEDLGLSRSDEEKRGYDTQMYQLRHHK